MPWKRDAKGNWVKGDAPVGAATLAKPKVNVPTLPTAPVPKTSVSKETTSTLPSTPKSLTSKVPSPQKASKPKVKAPKVDTFPAPEPALKSPEEVKPKVSEEPKVVQPKVVEKSLAPKEFASPPVVHDEIEPKGNVPKLSLSPAATTAKPVTERLFAPQSSSTRAYDPPPSLRPDPFDDISFDGTYLTSVTTEEVYNARTGMVERKTVSRSGRSNEHHYYSHLAGNPAAYKEEDEDDRSMSSMSMLFRNARGGRYTDPVESTNYATYQMDDDVTIDSFSSIFGLMKYPSKAAPKSNTLSDMENDDVLAGIIGDVSNLHDTDVFDHLDSIEPDHDVSPTANCSLSDFSELHDLEEQLERNPKKLDEMSMEAKSTSSGSKTDDVYSLDSTSTSSSLRSKNKRGRKNKIMCIIIFAFVVLSVISVIVFAEVNKKRERINGTLDDERDSPTQAPLPPGQTYQPTITVSPTKSPSRFTSQKPTNGSTVNFIDPIMNFLQENQIFFDRDPLSPDFMAVQWLADEAQIRIGDDGMSSVFGNGLEFSSKLIQRFALLTLDFALMRPDTPYTEQERESYARSNTIAVKYQDECQWTGVHCAEVGPLAGEVLEIDFSHAGLTGTIPNDVKLFKNLKKLHLAGNNIIGTIPTALFEIESLQHLYLYQNRLTGTIPDNIGNMWNMTHLHLSHNDLSGNIPESFKSIDGQVRPIEYLNLYSNKFTGTIPDDLGFSMIKFFDLGRNNFVGALPEDIGERWFELRYLHLDHNEFTGTIPDSYPTAGEGRIEAMTFNHNNLEGWIPGGFKFDKLLEFNVEDNAFTGIDKKVCKQSIFDGGEMVEYKTDCDICKCDPFCQLKCEL